MEKSLKTGLGLIGITSLATLSCGRQDSQQEAETAEQAASVRSCDDLTGISEEEIEKRDIYGYVEESSYPDMECHNCSLFIPPKEGETCGGCVLFEGPVFDEGYCDYWAPVT